MKSNFKFLLVLTVLLLGCICVGSTFAADVSISTVDDTINLESLDDSSQKVVEINNLQAGEGNFTELQKAVDDATGTLKLDKDYKYVSGDDMEDGVIINNSLIIDGQGHTLDGNYLTRIFVVNSNDVTLKNINFINGNPDSNDAGGAILWTGDNGSILNCSFNNCYTYNGPGGAITIVYSNDCIVDSCNFTNVGSDVNTAGAILVYGSDNCIVKSCNFINCSADIRGNAISFYCEGLKGTISDCNFVDCNGGTGAIEVESCADMLIDSCNFINCTSKTCAGAIFWYCLDGTIKGCNFTDCFAKEFASAIWIYKNYIDDDIIHLNIVDCNNKPLVGDLKAPIYNNAIILSDVVITTIEGDVKKVKYGDTINLIGTVTASGIPVAGRQLIFNVNGKEINAESDDYGLFSVNYTVDFVGEMNVDATYEGSMGPETVNMGKLISSKVDVIVTVDDVKGKAGEKVKFIAKVNDIYGNPIKDGVVIFGFNGKEYKANIVNGVATVKVVLPKAGTYSATAYYDGDEFHESAYAVFNVEVINNTDPNPNPDPTNHSGIPMEHTGNPLIALLFALICLPILKRK